MTLSFELSMRNSWGGKWSGANNLYVIVRCFRKGHPKLGYYSYDFGDGWCAGVTVREVTNPAARKLRKDSVGFCGYGWMVESIISDGDIYGPKNPKPTTTTP